MEREREGEGDGVPSFSASARNARSGSRDADVAQLKETFLLGASSACRYAENPRRDFHISLTYLCIIRRLPLAGIFILRGIAVAHVSTSKVEEKGNTLRAVIKRLHFLTAFT